MNIYEVVFYHSIKVPDEDTVYLVRAPDFQTAIKEVQINASPSDHGELEMPLADAVYEVGMDLYGKRDPNPRILLGPHSMTAFNFGWKQWSRKVDDDPNANIWCEDIK